MDISRLNGLASAHVRSFVFALLDTSDLGTPNRERLLNKNAASQLSRFLSDYAETKGVYMKINYVNADHVHVLVELPTSLSVENLVQLFKGSSSHWINANNMITGKFAWGRGYGAFSVSQSNA
jgi:REP-associated tyrosine transposase